MKAYGVSSASHVIFVEEGLMERFDFADLNIEFNDNLGIVEKLAPAVMTQVYLKDGESMRVCESGFSAFAVEKESLRFDRPITEFDFLHITKTGPGYFYRLDFFRRKASPDIYLDSLTVAFKPV